ncbi:hypothetical protein PAAG_04223 [Paracoccidioides lutzii Pb01]|uniref:F-box domain-containing protein n=1 Tax=Paracoccidioides lutzii (strain ATCC MYA-826 / Pb01) TaxID=502779 RepID=C1H0C9_PARBA|nr:hypothetical protein PAAG_04223 [Paracoccidioides lutzii Pb01]EEH33170.2 hypothetical protein PAAG_04223 [Paracoccidioides lutzii Pb01]
MGRVERAKQVCNIYWHVVSKEEHPKDKSSRTTHRPTYDPPCNPTITISNTLNAEPLDQITSLPESVTAQAGNSSQESQIPMEIEAVYWQRNNSGELIHITVVLCHPLKAYGHSAFRVIKLWDLGNWENGDLPAMQSLEKLQLCGGEDDDATVDGFSITMAKFPRLRSLKLWNLVVGNAEKFFPGPIQSLCKVKVDFCFISTDRFLNLSAAAAKSLYICIRQSDGTTGPYEISTPKLMDLTVDGRLPPGFRLKGLPQDCTLCADTFLLQGANIDHTINVAGVRILWYEGRLWIPAWTNQIGRGRITSFKCQNMMLTRSLWNALRSCTSLRVVHIYVARHNPDPPPLDPLVEPAELFQEVPHWINDLTIHEEQILKHVWDKGIRVMNGRFQALFGPRWWSGCADSLAVFVMVHSHHSSEVVEKYPKYGSLH